ncbi:hypothetical protein BAUCODRAFT_281987 [Baudoinia panamericana UAMH 10762]|uniref:Zinc finger PHD-type domain-containing protein n=1 Tax=Baudoinia panamericana (strain UAMH 10762) TaxID=717646 RepID=M2LE09_BAUPA|nr:uncharacterized protein BAUCODRAFT_281987 [Baudoinia panamericana UAMH 10762]EMC92212.1 hypothetical protein BAUCODRAFT_281987 [Baudoinia panamericana UAMH 10762]
MDVVYGRDEKEVIETTEELDDGIVPVVDIAHTYCVCAAPADGYMVECIKCTKNFHPHCVGKGQSSYYEYQRDDLRDLRRQDDAAHWNAEGTFTCARCDEAARSAARSIAEDERRTATPLKLSLQMESKAHAVQRKRQLERWQAKAGVEMRKTLKNADGDEARQDGIRDEYKLNIVMSGLMNDEEEGRKKLKAPPTLRSSSMRTIAEKPAFGLQKTAEKKSRVGKHVTTRNTTPKSSVHSSATRTPNKTATPDSATGTLASAQQVVLNEPRPNATTLKPQQSTRGFTPWDKADWRAMLAEEKREDTLMDDREEHSEV